MQLYYNKFLYLHVSIESHHFKWLLPFCIKVWTEVAHYPLCWLSGYGGDWLQNMSWWVQVDSKRHQSFNLLTVKCVQPNLVVTKLHQTQLYLRDIRYSLYNRILVIHWYLWETFKIYFGISNTLLYQCLLHWGLKFSLFLWMANLWKIRPTDNF